MSVKSKVIYGKTVQDGNVPTFLRSGIVFKGIHKDAKSSFSLSDDTLARHLMLIGGTGSGKTNVFYHLLSQIKKKMTKDDIMIVFDTKGDFYNEFYDNNVDVVLGNSSQYQNNSVSWNIFKEILADGTDENKIKENINEISSSIFCDAIKKNNSQPFFPNAAKDLFSGVLKIFIDDGLKYGKEQKQLTFYNSFLSETFANWRIEDYIKQFSRRKGFSSLASYLGSSGSDQGLGVLAEMLSVVNKLFVGKFGEKGMFSIRDFVKNKGGRTLFIEYDLSLGSSLSPIYQLLIDLSLKEAMGRNKKTGNVYLIFDEFKLLPNLNHIENAVNFGRSLGIKVIAGLQTIGQLSDSYGENVAKNIIGGFSSYFIFRANDYDTKKYFSGLYGKNLVLDQYSGFANNLISEKREGNVIEDWTFNELRTGEAIIGIESCDPFVFRFDLYNGRG